MIPLWLMPIMIVGLCLMGGCLALWTCGADRRAEKEAAHQQELRDIDAWLELVWKS